MKYRIVEKATPVGQWWYVYFYDQHMNFLERRGAASEFGINQIVAAVRDQVKRGVYHEGFDLTT